MIQFKSILFRILPAVQLILSLVWLSNLAATDSYFSIYVLIAFASCFLQIKGLSSGGGRTASVLSVLFSIAVMLANYPLFTTIGDPAVISRSTSLLMNLINGGLSFLGGICVAQPILAWFFDTFPRKPGNPFIYRKKWIPVLVFLSFVMFHLVHLLLVEFPGNVTEDSFTQISEMVSGTYSNFNTYWHTMIFQGLLSVGFAISGTANGAVAAFSIAQILILALAFTYCLMTMADWGVPRWMLLSAYLLYAIVPYNMALSITIWKDVLFAAGCLLMLSAWVRIMKQLGRLRWLDYTMFILGSFLFILSRTNGWLLCLISCLAMALVSRKNKAFLALMGGVALAGWALLNPALALLGVGEGDIVESLSIPIQQVSRVIAEGGSLTEEETALLSRVVDLEEVPALYTSWLSDPMKVEVRSKDGAYFLENLDAYRDLWIRLGLRYPWQYVKAWVDQTRGYWNGGYSYFMYAETITDNPYGVEKVVSGNPIASAFHLYFGLSRHLIFFQPLHSIGLHIWLTIVCFVLNLKKRAHQGVILVPLLVLVLGLWLGTPVYACFRYVYPLFVSFPLILAVSLWQPHEA